ncbi:hypothetical protein VF11_25225 [Nostoc linckia z14]|nr:hypothetical protein VF11_25225 [Nostoc linckia z14]
MKGVSAVEKALGDRVAEEANARMWHMRLVESFVAVSGNYIKEKPTVERFAETTLILWKMIAKIQGDKALQRPNLGKEKVKLTVGEPISISERYPAYKENRLGARQAVADVTNDLQQGLEKLI